jgi:PAS domain S-box-containing protein
MLALARRLAGVLRSGDVLARTGADAFAVLLPAGEEAALSVARRLAAATRLPIAVPGGELVVSANAGVAVGRRWEPGAVVIGNAEAALAATGPAGAEPLAYGRQMPAQTQPAEADATPVLQDPLANLQLLQQAAVAANEAGTLEEAAQRVARQVGNHVSCDVSQVWVSPAASAADRPSSVWQLVAGARPATHQVADDFLAGKVAALAGRVVSTGRPAWLPDIAVDERGSAGLRSAFAFPVTVAGEVVAVLAFFSGAHMEPSGSFEDVVTGIATHLSRLVERQRAAAALRRSAEQLRASEALLAAVHRAGRLGSWRIDLRTGEATRAEGVRELYGIEPGERIDFERLLSVVDARDRDRAAAALRGLVQTGQATTDEFRIRGPKGQLRWLRVHGSAVRDEFGHVVAIDGTAQDVTETKHAQDALLERERQLAEAQRTLVVGWWDHELYTGRLTWSE